MQGVSVSFVCVLILFIFKQCSVAMTTLKFSGSQDIKNYWSIEKSIHLLQAYEQEILIWDPLVKYKSNGFIVFLIEFFDHSHTTTEHVLPPN